MSKRDDLSKKNDIRNEQPEAQYEPEVREMTEQDREIIDMSLKVQGQGKNTGFETNHAAQKYKASAFRSLNGNVDGLLRRDPKRAYKLISFNDFRSNGYRDPRGWIPLTKQNCSVEDFPEPSKEFGINITTDGFWHVTDRIWAFKPIDAYAEDRFKIAEKTKIRTSGLTKDFKQAATKGLENERAADIEDITKRI
jgi:hypothetical protein